MIYISIGIVSGLIILIILGINLSLRIEKRFDMIKINQQKLLLRLIELETKILKTKGQIENEIKR